jgi:ATP-binding cassette subfamily C protein
MPRYIIESARIAAIAVFILGQVLSGDLSSSAATIGVFLSGGLRLTASLLPLQSALLQIKQSVPIAGKALEILELDRSHTTSQDTEVEASHLGNSVHVAVENLSFVFRGEKHKTIDNLTFRIPPGSQVAFIGPSGAGKSTLADLLLGILEPSSGTILLNDIRPAALAQSKLGILGYVPQKPGLISGTIAQNIALGIEPRNIEKKKLNRAISAAHLGDYVASLPNGVHTNIGKRKDELSGGQLQRIGLARALYHEPKLLVMDEATSALDAQSEDKINDALDAMRGTTTVILIAHRLNTIQRSDLVYLMENGKITAEGTFQELVERNDTVKNLANLMAIKSDEQ